MSSEASYSQIIRYIFKKHHNKGTTEFQFTREEIEEAVNKLQLRRPKNFGDVVYSFRYRKQLPKEILVTAPDDQEWVILPDGSGIYKFFLASPANINPADSYKQIKIPHSTPNIIEKYALTDEQALLAKIRYNRLVDIFTGLTCYSLQNHLRTQVPDLGQVETDEIYLGLDNNGVQYILPVQAKGGNDKLGYVQIWQDVQMCQSKFPNLVCRPVGAQALDERTIALFELAIDGNKLVINNEKHYCLASHSELTDDEITEYRRRLGL